MYRILFALAGVAVTQLLRLLGVFSVIDLVAGGALGRVAENAGAANRLVLDVVQGAEQFTVGAVHVRLVPGEFDHVEDAGGLVEDAVHLFQRTIGGLGEEEVDDGDDEGVTVEVSTMVTIRDSSQLT